MNPSSLTWGARTDSDNKKGEEKIFVFKVNYFVGEFILDARRGRSASSIDIARDKRPRPTKPASIGKPETEEKPSR